MKIVKPLSLGILHRPYLYRGQHRLALAALGFFPLGAAAADRFLSENLQWAKIVPQLPLGLPLEHILPKARAEVLLSGAAHALGQPAQAMQVRLQCGPIDKTLRVFGDRAWRRRAGPWLCVDPATPFERQPLDWENAYGGPGHANPAGRGFLPRLAWLRCLRGRMPNVEYPQGAPLPGRLPRPAAGFAPLNLVGSPLLARSGSYDKRWLEEDFPGLPRDFDFALFNVAPADQQFAGRFQGNEAYCLEGLHPRQATLRGTLPGLVARAFVLRQGGAAEQAEEVPLVCDTVWFFPELDLGMAVFRGETPVSDSDALDIAALMVAYERHGEAPRPLAHYRRVLALRLDPQSAALHAFDEGQLAPPRDPAALAARAAARERQLAAEVAHRQSLLDEHMSEFWRRSGLTPPPGYTPPVAPPSALRGPSPDELAEGEFALAELYAQARSLAERARCDGEARLAAGQTLAAQTTAAGSAAEPVARILARAAEIAHDLATPPAERPDPVPAALRALMTAGAATDGARGAQVATAFAELPASRRAARNLARQPTTLDAPLPDAAAIALGRQVRQWLSEGVALAGRDLAGACLRDMDLRRADLREAMLERADLRGARLAEARLDKAVLTAACLDGADFSRACLDGANLCGTRGEGVRFGGASLCGARALEAHWPGADLRGARLDELIATDIVLGAACLDDTQATHALLLGAKAAGSSWRNTQWLGVVATGADLGRADFSGAQLKRSVLMDAQLQGSIWHGARLDGVYAGGKADWEGASLRAAHFSRCGLQGVRMMGADLGGGVFTQSDFGGADLSDACLEGARFYRSLFMRSRLRRVRAARADFFQALCRKADFSRAQLQEAVLVQADGTEAQWQGADLAGATVDRKASLR